MKNLLSLFFALTFIAQALGYSFEVGGIYYDITSGEDQTVGITYLKSFPYSGEITIPASVSYSGTTYSVTSIGYSAFSGCYSLTSITIPNSVTSIGGSAFEYCSSLTSITIPEGVTSIGEYAFYGCDSINEVNVSCKDDADFLAYLSRNDIFSIFYSKINSSTTHNILIAGEKQTSITIPEGVTSIGNYAFYNCSNLTSITIPNSVASIEYEAFCRCSGLTSITIPNSVTSIGSSAFSGCSSLTSITIPNSVTSIGNYAFYGCIRLPVIGNIRYADTYLVEVVDKTQSSYSIKEGTRFISSDAFYNCSGLTSITIPNSVTSIGECAFYGCSSLNNITIPKSMTNIDSYAFSECSSLTNITIPNSVTSIGNFAFYGCSSLTSITIPEGVTSIGEYAFDGCNSLTDCYVNWATPLDISSKDVFYNSNQANATLHVPAGTKALYEAAEGWKDFGTIVEEEVTALRTVMDSGSAAGSFYRLDGTRHNATPTKGQLYLQHGKKAIVR